jgi:nicotinate-nucleotide adenylyltransferase
MKQPNYTIDTLTYLGEKFPEHTFALIMGEDNLKSFHKWKNYELILQEYAIYIYPRISMGQIETQFKDHPNITRIEAPIMELSSTFIRKEIKAGRVIKPMLPEAVWTYVDEMNFYK